LTVNKFFAKLLNAVNEVFTVCVMCNWRLFAMVDLGGDEKRENSFPFPDKAEGKFVRVTGPLGCEGRVGVTKMAEEIIQQLKPTSSIEPVDRTGVDET
jgi:hypothetical protein